MFLSRANGVEEGATRVEKSPGFLFASYTRSPSPSDEVCAIACVARVNYLVGI